MKTILRLALILLLAAIAPAIFCATAHAQIVIIANPNIEASDVSRADLRDVFTGAASSIKGASHVTPVLLRVGPTHEEMLSLYIGKSDSAFRATWRSVVFAGVGTMPRSLDTEAAVVDFVAHSPGAIGYIGKATPHDNVKTLAVR